LVSGTDRSGVAGAGAVAQALSRLSIRKKVARENRLLAKGWLVSHTWPENHLLRLEEIFPVINFLFLGVLRLSC
jgi:hypothetical protein